MHRATSHFYYLLFFLILPPPPRSTLFPYTTLFRSRRGVGAELRRHLHRGRQFDGHPGAIDRRRRRSEEHTSELQSRRDLVCRLLLEKKKLVGDKVRTNERCGTP